MNMLVTLFFVAAILLTGGLLVLVFARARLRAVRAAASRLEEARHVYLHGIGRGPQPVPRAAFPPGVPHARPWVPAPAPPSFDADELARFKAAPALADTPCGICLDSFDDLDITAGQCLHTFHTACVGAWLAKDPALSCPVCRAAFVDPTDAPESFGRAAQPPPPPLPPAYVPPFALPMAVHTAAAVGARQGVV